MKQDEAYEKLMRRGLAGAAVLGLLMPRAATPTDRARLSEAGAIAKSMNAILTAPNMLRPIRRSTKAAPTANEKDWCSTG